MMTRQKNSTTNGATYDQGGSAQWSQICLLFYTLLFWMSGFTLIFLALWALLDPRRSYVLDLVDFSEDEPLLKAAVYMCIIVGVAILLVGFIACCGAIKKSRCMLTTFVIFVALIFCAECVIGALAISYRSKFLVSNFDVKLVRMMRDEYGIRLNNPRNNRITQLIDRLQFYEECCGSKNATNWEGSRWKKTSAASLGNSLLSNSAVAADFPDFSEERAYAALFSSVPVTCCVQLSGATPVNPVARSMARCQQPQATKWWRYQVGCHEKLHQWLNVQTTIFASVAFALAVFQMIGICLAITLFRQAPSLTRSSSLILLPPSATKPTSAGYSQITSNTS